ncbi:response regulator [Streptomyces sp. NEAU-W12]|uniref:response regulator n=1 Tax=Streptomyces sp. NEAU-W12 TaxID=2994668 RepID=UPI00224B01ED|nr:response regulator transcription factor [Streptomyces sp. NEAU-W12]MCX2925272.1 response regulator transcription factor [Streptomyces sp. NEAU-W12]
MTPIRVLLVDDQPLIRTGFRYILEAEDDIVVVGEAADGWAALYEARALQPDIVLMDIRMPHVDGVDATRSITEELPGCRVIILTTFDLDAHVVHALRAGAVGFLVKDGPADSLVHAVRTVAAGEAILAPRVTHRLLSRFAQLEDDDAQRFRPASPPGLSALTTRETDVLRAVARGLTNAEIARELTVSETTVKTHISSIFDKYRLRSRAQAVILAYDTGLVQPVPRT